MKDKFGTFSKAVVVILVIALITAGLIALVDTKFNGVVGDWYEDNFLIVEHTVEGESDKYVEAINWPQVKTFIIALAVALVILWATTIYITSAICYKKLVKQATINSGKVIRDYFTRDGVEQIDLPAEYSDVIACVKEIKAQNKRSEQILQYEASRKNDLIAYLAHDLKTPLTSIIGYLSLLQEAPDMPTEQRAKYVDIAFDKAVRLESLINEFFEITRFNLHQITLDKETFNLTHMLTQLSDEFYPVLIDHGNTVSVKVCDNLVITADPLKLARVFNNILKNAISYSYPDTPIKISAEKAAQKVVITFENSGKTIPQSKLDSIFEKFYRLDDARSTNTGGAGLGLAIAKEIVSLHGGTIGAFSDAEKVIFKIELPG